MLYSNDHYQVMVTDDALGEDGNYGRGGYAVVNKETQIAEHTTMIYPQAIFQADALSGALTQLTAPSSDANIIEAMSTDVLPN